MDDDGFIDISICLRAAIYMLLWDGRVQYIGKSKNPLRRIPGHYPGPDGLRWKNGVSFDGFRFNQLKILPCPKHKLDEIEQRLIRKYCPPYNIKLYGAKRKPTKSLDEICSHLNEKKNEEIEITTIIKRRV